MKEHPDYKYRPRRKPKPLLANKSPVHCDRNSSGGGGPNSLSSNNNNNPNHLNHNHLQNNHLLSTSGGDYMNLHANGNSTVAAAAAVAAKYPFGPPLDQLALGLGPPRHPAFSHISHYGSALDPAFAIDLHTRIQAMCGGLYHPWRYFGCPPVLPNSESPPPAINRHSPRSVSPTAPPSTANTPATMRMHCESPTNLKISHSHSPTMQPSDLSMTSRLKQSPPPAPAVAAKVIWPTPLRFSGSPTDHLK